MWSPTSYILDGVFATGEDLDRAVDVLRALIDSPVVLAVFSGRRLVRSVSRARSEDTDWNDAVVGRIHSELPDRLPRSQEMFDCIHTLVTEELRAVGCAEAEVLSFGGNLDRPGGVGAIVAGCDMSNEEAHGHAEMAVACAFASRPVAFSLDTSLELAALSELREAAKRARPDVPTLVNTSRAAAVEALLRFAGGVLGTNAIVAFEADQQDPHRFTHLNLYSCVIPGGGEIPEWVPQRVQLSEELGIPEPPELGGSQFDDLHPLVEHCIESNGRPRRLVAGISGSYQAYGVPYGFDDVRRRPIGVLCLVWDRRPGRNVGTYETAAGRIIAQHLARGYNARHSAEAVRLVTRQLTYISDLPSTSEADGVIECDEILQPRLDVKLISSSVSQIVSGLVNLSGAMSVTCRLLTGAGGIHLSRHLVRLHAEGGASATESPGRISLEDSARSVNAWVAMTGEPVYLRTLQPEPGSGHYVSPDLDSYEGLDQISIYREGVECELCIPIVAESRLVGTVNLEADRPFAFDAMAETVREYAQLIGIALLEARRRIGVDAVTEVEGLLDYRHRLDSELDQLAGSIRDEPTLPEQLRGSYLGALEKIHKLIFMRRVEESNPPELDYELGEIVRQAMQLVRWATRKMEMDELLVEAWSEAARRAYSARVDAESARPLTYAIAQALLNIREHGGSGDALAGRRYSAMFRFGEVSLGGHRKLFVAISSTCSPEKFADLDPQRIFREPVERNGRVSLGAFLAGEALRRHGGSAYLRLAKSDDHDWIVDAEFSVPAA